MLSVAAAAADPSLEKKCVPLPSVAGEITAKLYVPPSSITGPRSSDTSTSAAAGPMRPNDAASYAGLVLYVIVASDQLLSATTCTSPPSPSDDDSVRVCIESRTDVTLPSIGGTSNLRYASLSAASTARSPTSGKIVSACVGPVVTSSTTGTVIVVMSLSTASQQTSTFVAV